jgi:hypothetical protein
MEFIQKNKAFTGVAIGATLLGAFIALDSLRQVSNFVKNRKAKEEKFDDESDDEGNHTRGRRASTNEEFTQEIERYKPIFKICLTGGTLNFSLSFLKPKEGPCAGKTTSMAYISSRLNERGYAVFIVPEMATITCLAGANIIPSFYSKPNAARFQVSHF